MKVYMNIQINFENFPNCDKIKLKTIFTRDYTDFLILRGPSENMLILKLLTFLVRNLPYNQNMASLPLDLQQSKLKY